MYYILYMKQYYVLFSYFFFCLESLGSSTVTFSEARRSFKTEVCGMYDGGSAGAARMQPLLAPCIKALLRLYLYEGSVKALSLSRLN